MARIYDNIEIKFEQGLKDIIESSGVKRVDFCVGYFNLRGWDKVVEHVEQLEGDFVFEGRANKHRTCRLILNLYRRSNGVSHRIFVINFSLAYRQSMMNGRFAD